MSEEALGRSLWPPMAHGGPHTACSSPLCSGTFHFPDCSLHGLHPRALWDLLLWQLPQTHKWVPWGQDAEAAGREMPALGGGTGASLPAAQRSGGASCVRAGARHLRWGELRRATQSPARSWPFSRVFHQLAGLSSGCTGAGRTRWGSEPPSVRKWEANTRCRCLRILSPGQSKSCCGACQCALQGCWERPRTQRRGCKRPWGRPGAGEPGPASEGDARFGGCRQEGANRWRTHSRLSVGL